ncbi:MAG: hypothetical protein Q8P67_26565, partial [archaeon]|nr:hypothetical protein [archaeon]
MESEVDDMCCHLEKKGEKEKRVHTFFVGTNSASTFFNSRRSQGSFFDDRIFSGINSEPSGGKTDGCGRAL